MFRALITIACLCLFAGAASATILNVPGDYPTIQAAIDAAVIGDEIVIAAGSYTTEASINHGGLTIRGVGEAILASPGGPYAMGIYGSLELDYLPTVLENLTFTGYYMGFSFDTDFPAELHNCTFRQNQYGIWGCGPGPIIVRDCRFEDNYGPGYGAGLSSCGAELDVTDCVFLNNTAELGGGALYIDTSFGLPRVVVNCLFVGNDAPRGAAVLMAYGGEVTLQSCTLVANGNSGASAIDVQDSYSTLHVDRCIVSGSAGYAFSCTDGGILSITCTDAWGNAEGDWTDCAAGQLGVNGNFSEDPLYCGEAGGPDGYYTLQGGSPCAPSNSPCGDQVGAFGVGCDVTAARETSFSAIKQLY